MTADKFIPGNIVYGKHPDKGWCLARVDRQAQSGSGRWVLDFSHTSLLTPAEKDERYVGEEDMMHPAEFWRDRPDDAPSPDAAPLDTKPRDRGPRYWDDSEMKWKSGAGPDDPFKDATPPSAGSVRYYDSSILQWKWATPDEPKAPLSILGRSTVSGLTEFMDAVRVFLNADVASGEAARRSSHVNALLAHFNVPRVMDLPESSLLEAKHFLLGYRSVPADEELPEWRSTQQYERGVWVRHKGGTYRAMSSNHNNEPGDSEPWFHARPKVTVGIMESAAEAGVQFSGLDPVTKDTNPKDALAGFKPRWFSFLPLRVLVGVGKALFEGGWKYGKHNYRESGVRASVYLDACVCGHLMPFMEGQNHDENGMHHIDKAIASLMVLRDAQIGGNWIDDRPIAAHNFDEVMEAETAHFQQMKVALREKFGDPVAPYTEATHGRTK